MSSFKNNPSNINLQQQAEDITKSLSITEFNQEVFSKAINAIRNLCKNNAIVQLTIKQGTKICALCNGVNGGEQYSCSNAACGQIYHTQCVINMLTNYISSFYDAISKCNIYAQVDEYQIALEYSCSVCGALHTFPQALYDYIAYEYENIKDFKQKQKDWIREQSSGYNAKWSSCQACQESWVKPELQRRIFDLDPFDDNILMETKKLPLYHGQNADGTQKETTWIRFSKCKHLFCKECLMIPVASSIYSESVTVKDKNLFNHVLCPEAECNAPIGFKEMEKILSNKFNWFLRYKNNLMMNCIKQLPGEMHFIRCLGVYKIQKENCENVKFTDLNQQIAITKEVWEKFNTGQLDLSKLTLQKNAGERVEPCGRVYHYNTSNQDLQKLFADYVSNIEDQDEREIIRVMLEEYSKSHVIQQADLAKNADKNVFKCESDMCLFQICLNGCLAAHPGNKCPQNGNLLRQNNPVIVPLDRVVKEIKNQCLFFGTSDNIVITPSMQFCFVCLRQLKMKQGVKPIDQIVPGNFLPCECANEFKQNNPNPK